MRAFLLAYPLIGVLVQAGFYLLALAEDARAQRAEWLQGVPPVPPDVMPVVTAHRCGLHVEAATPVLAVEGFLRTDILLPLEIA